MMILAKEICFIKNSNIREAVKFCVIHYMEILEELPSSLSGKYHPIDERGNGGLIIHIRKVVWYCRELQREFELSDEDMDCLLVASILHDISLCEITIKDGDRWRRNNNLHKLHPIHSAWIALNYIAKEVSVRENAEIVLKIFKLISSHMDHWYPQCPQPTDILQKMFNMADYFVSRENVKIMLDD